MLGIIISGHGGFATGMEKAMLQIIGTQEQTVAIDFPEESTSQKLMQQFEDALKEVDTGDGVVFLTDLLGGTPFRTASTLSLARDDMEVLTGCNLQLILEMMLERDELTAPQFRTLGVESGHRGLTSLFDELAKSRKEKSSSEDDGI